MGDSLSGEEPEREMSVSVGMATETLPPNPSSTEDPRNGLLHVKTGAYKGLRNGEPCKLQETTVESEGRGQISSVVVRCDAARVTRFTVCLLALFAQRF